MSHATRRQFVAGSTAAFPLMLVDGPRHALAADTELPMIVLAPPGGATHLPLIIKAKGFDKKAGINVATQAAQRAGGLFQ